MGSGHTASLSPETRIPTTGCTAPYRPSPRCPCILMPGSPMLRMPLPCNPLPLHLAALQPASCCHANRIPQPCNPLLLHDTTLHPVALQPAALAPHCHAGVSSQAGLQLADLAPRWLATLSPLFISTLVGVENTNSYFLRLCASSSDSSIVGERMLHDRCCPSCCCCRSLMSVVAVPSPVTLFPLLLVLKTPFSVFAALGQHPRRTHR